MREIFLSYRDCLGIRSLAKNDKPTNNEQRKFARRLHEAFERSHLNTNPTGRRIILPLQIVESTLQSPLSLVHDKAINLWWDNLASISSSSKKELRQEDEMVLLYILILLKDLCLSGNSDWWPSGDKALKYLLKDKPPKAASVVEKYFAEDRRLEAD